LSGYDFATARKLSTGAAKKVVEQREQACKGAACDAKRESIKDKLGSASELLKRTASYSLARVWSEGDESPQKYLAVLKREGRGWLVESYSPDNGRLVELPGETSIQNPGIPPTPASPTSSATPPVGASSAVLPPGHPPMPGYTTRDTAAQPPAPGVVKPPRGALKPAPTPAPGAGNPSPPAKP